VKVISHEQNLGKNTATTFFQRSSMTAFGLRLLQLWPGIWLMS